MDRCDFCEAEFEWADRHVVALPRPSDPAELVSVMASCPPCGLTQGLPTAVELFDAIEDGKPVDGRHYLFVTV